MTGLRITLRILKKQFWKKNLWSCWSSTPQWTLCSSLISFSISTLHSLAIQEKSSPTIRKYEGAWYRLSQKRVIINIIFLFSHYLRSGFVIDLMACLPYDALNAFSSNSSFYTNIFSILKVDTALIPLTALTLEWSTLILLLYWHQGLCHNI